MTEKTRCGWCGDDPLYQDYHDREWGVPQKEDQALFAKLCLEGFQAGLSWITILRKRQTIMEAFDHFDPESIAGYGEEKVDSLMHNSGIVRNRLKIRSVITNARAFLAVQEKRSFAAFVWEVVEGKPKVNGFASLAEVPSKTAESERLAKALKKAGFKFCGPTICYAFMQSVGMVNDHTVDCFCHRKCAEQMEGFRVL